MTKKSQLWFSEILVNLESHNYGYLEKIHTSISQDLDETSDDEVEFNYLREHDIKLNLKCDPFNTTQMN